MQPGKQIRRPDGGDYDPLKIRIAASIFQPASGKAKRGRMLDGWQVELFAADVPASAWPAPEVVAAYFGRNGTQENRFAQEDRELGLDRIFSYHLPGQELACLIGMMVWNLRVVMGFEAEPPPAEVPATPPRVPQVDERVASSWPRDPQVVSSLGEAELSESVKKKPAWSFDAVTGTVQCAAGRVLEVTSVRKGETASGRTGVIFRRPVGGCTDCAVRSSCLRSRHADAAKHAEFSVPSAVAAAVRARLSAVRSHRSVPWIVPPAGAQTVSVARFLPAMARQVFAERFAQGTLWVSVERPPPPRPRPRLVAADEADRQRRRKTWAQNLARYALPDTATVHITVAGTPALRRMIREPEQQRSKFADSGSWNRNE